MFVVYLTELNKLSMIKLIHNHGTLIFNLKFGKIYKRNHLKFIYASVSESLHVATILKWILFSSKYIYTYKYKYIVDTVSVSFNRG